MIDRIVGYGWMRFCLAVVAVGLAASLCAGMMPERVLAQSGNIPEGVFQEGYSASSGGDAFPVIFEALDRAVLSAERAGVLTSLKYEAGSPIKKGNLIAQVDTGELALQKKRSELSLRHLNVKVSNLERLNQKGLATNEDLAEVRMQRDVVRTDIEILKRQIGNSLIYAPFDGVVVRRHVQPHEWVTIGQPVVDLISPTRIRAVGNIPSWLAVQLKKGDRHSFYVNDLDATIAGIVDAVVPEVDELSNTAQVIWTLESPGNELLPGMKGEVRING